MPESVLVHPQYVDQAQQREASHIGMCVFLATEVMFFGVLFTGFSYFQHLYPDAFASASRHADFWLGTVNTGVLLTSSLTMALAVQAAKKGQRRALRVFLTLTMGLGAAFLACKGMEYTHHIRDHLFPGASFEYDPLYARHAELFFFLYFTMTGLHALHMIIGIGVLAVIWELSRRGRFSAGYPTPVELVGLYWHFVDVIWIFLFPMFYLLGGH